MTESGDVVTALMERVVRARAEAERVVVRSAILVTARRTVADPETMVKRCAWCERLLLANHWVPEDEVPHFIGTLLDPRTTHGICSRCLEQLRRDGWGRAVER